jgi:hypothetical protein
MSGKKEAWYVYGIVSLIAMVLTYFAYVDYHDFIHPENLGSGKNSKLFLLIFNIIDSTGGKWFVLACMTLITVALLVKTAKRFKTGKYNR